MKKNLLSQALFGIATFSFTLPSANAATPTSGAYVTDPQSSYVSDIATESIKNANNIMCFLANTRPDAMVNSGTYVAFIDEAKCDSSSRSDPSQSSSTSSAGTTNYTRMSLTSTRASNADAQVLKGHAEVNNNVGKMPVYVHASATQAPSATAPNGVITINYTGKEPTNTTTILRGKIATTANSLTTSENMGFGGNTESRQAYVTGDTTSGSGAIRLIQNGFTINTYTFGYNQLYFCRNSGAADQCFERSLDKALSSVWQYGVYDDNTGAQYNISQPGFPIKDSSNRYGYASYWGIWLPTAAADGATVTHAQNGTPYTIKNSTGRLIKFSKITKTLDDLRKIPFSGFLPNTPASNGAGVYQASWNGTNFVIDSKQNCAAGPCKFEKLATPETVSPGLAAAATGGPTGTGMNVYSQAMGSMINIPYSTLTAGTPGSSPVYLNSQTNVLPGDTVPASLKCVRDCPLTSLLAAVSTSNSPYSANTRGKWNNTASGDVITYAWNSNAYTLTPNAEAALSNTLLPVKTALDSTQYAFGIRSGALVDAANINQLECSMGSNTFCDFKASALTEYYVFETGRQPWNTTTFLKKADNSYLAFTAPQTAVYTVPSNVTGALPYGDFAGATMNLQFMGFGQLQGIPGKCFSNVDNTEASCTGANVRYSPAFAIATGSTVTINGTTKYVKWLDREIRFAPKAGNAAGLGIVMGSAANLPAAMLLNGDAEDPSTAANTTYYPGNYTNVDFSKSPSIIHGVVQ